MTLRFERGTAFAQHIITLRSQLRRLVRARAATRGAWDDAGPARARRPARRARRGALADDPDVHHRGRGHRHAVAVGLGGEARLQRAEPGDQRAGGAGCSAAGRSAACGTTGVDAAEVGARLPLVAPVHDRGGHLADPAQPHRRADPRDAEGRDELARPRRDPGARLRALHRRAVVQRHPRRHGRGRDPRREARGRRGPLGAGGDRGR